MFDLSGRTALITGASGGIGGAIAARPARPRRRGDACRPAGRGAARARRRLGDRVHVAVAALDDPAAPERLVQEAEAAMGRIDILVNNAGLNRDALALRMTDADWQTVIDIDLTAAFRLTRSVLRGMVRRRHGRVIAISSVVAVAGNPGQANYAAAKAAMIGMSKSIAAEVARRGITVNCIAPGYIVTSDDRASDRRATGPAGRRHSRRTIRQPRRCRRCRRLSGEFRSRLCHRSHLARQRRLSHDIGWRCPATAGPNWRCRGNDAIPTRLDRGTRQPQHHGGWRPQTQRPTRLSTKPLKGTTDE